MRDAAACAAGRVMAAGGAGALSGFFGIGGGFLIVSGRALATGMPVLEAVRTSRFSVGTFGLTTAFRHALSGLVAWRIALQHVVGGSFGSPLAQRAASRTAALQRVFSGVVVAVAAHMLVVNAHRVFGQRPRRGARARSGRPERRKGSWVVSGTGPARATSAGPVQAPAEAPVRGRARPAAPMGGLCVAREFSADRYRKMPYRRCGRSGLLLPAISLGAWETFGGYRGEEVARECLFRAFDLGITHFDLANNYGRPPGNAESVVGRVLKEMPRDELIISTKAGYRMWPGPYGEWLGKKSMVASLDQSLRRMQLDYVDIYYAHRPDPETPLEETLEALDLIVRQGKALYIGVSSFSGVHFEAAQQVITQHRLLPITIHQPHYNMLSRGPEHDLFPHTQRAGTGVIAFCPLAQGVLTDKYLGDELPTDSRAALWWGKKTLDEAVPEARREKLRALNDIARARGQSLAQMALAWILRLPAVTSALIGASKVSQIEENVAALDHLDFSRDELDRIDAVLR